MLNLPLAFLQCSSLKADVFVKLKIDNRIHPASVQVQLYCCNIFTNGRLHYISSLCDWKHNSVSMFPSRHVRWNVVSRWHGSMSTSAHLWPRLTTLGDAVSWVSSRVMMSGWWKSSGSRVSPKPCLNLSNSRHLCVWALCIFVTGRGQKGGDMLHTSKLKWEAAAVWQKSHVFMCICKAAIYSYVILVTLS